ncbi:MAG: LPS export ABC transporter periplasmic protein LptC [Muribaculaceae bacterium]|nr:LPS export ABC transporter periplasmic protein LptC [Muribaculaceae bacterium]
MSFCACLLLAACGEDDKLGVTNAVDASKMPQLSTRDVSTLISDSGYTKYKVVTPLWNVFGGTDKEAYWDFPEGVYLRQLDHDLKVVSTVAADSAVYFPNRKLWELYGNVEIDQENKAYFFSQRIFFDDKQKRIFSDTFIHIKTPTQILEGIGFESNENMTQYRVLQPTGMFPTHQLEDDAASSASSSSRPEPQPLPAPRPMRPAPASLSSQP